MATLKKFNIYLKEDSEVLGGFLFSITGTKKEAISTCRKEAMRIFKDGDYKEDKSFTVYEVTKEATEEQDEDEELAYYMMIYRCKTTGHINIQKV